VVSHHLVAAKVQLCQIGSWDTVLARVWADQTIVEFLAKTHPIHYFRSKTHILGGFAPFGTSKSVALPNRVLGCRLVTSVGRWNYCRVFQSKLIQSTTLGPKPTFWVVSHHLFATRALLRNRVLGCRFHTGSGRRNYYRVFTQKRIQSTTLGPKLTFWVVSHHLFAASALLRNRVLGCCFGTSSGRQNYCRVFRPKCFQSTNLGPKLMFWVVSHHVVAASAPLQNWVPGYRFGMSSGRWNY